MMLGPVSGPLLNGAGQRRAKATHRRSLEGAGHRRGDGGEGTRVAGTWGLPASPRVCGKFSMSPHLGVGGLRRRSEVVFRYLPDDFNPA
jgi:hypothetical protein